MPRLRMLRRAGPLGLALTLWDVYSRLSPRQRKQVVALARKHGPKVATKTLKLYAGYRGRARGR